MRLHILLGFFLVSLFVRGQNRSIYSDPVSWNNFDGNNHYPGNIKGITQSSDGYVWLFGAMGLQRYDGYESLSFTVDSDDPTTRLVSNNVTSVCEMKDKKIWIGTYDNGINVYDPKLSEVTVFEWPEKDLIPQVLDIYQDTLGTIWIGTVDHGLLRFGSDGKMKYFRNHEVVPDKRHPSNVISAIKENANHPNVLFLGTGSGIMEFDKVSSTFIRNTDNDNHEGPKVNDVVDFEYIDGRIFLYVWEDGFYEYDPLNKIYALHTSVSFLPFSHVNQFFKVSSEEILIATDRGLYTYSGQSGLRLFSGMPQWDVEIFAINKIDDGSIWFSTRTEDQVYISDPKAVTVKKFDISLYGSSKFNEKIITGFMPVSNSMHLVSAFGMPGIVNFDSKNHSSSFFDLTLNSYRDKGTYVDDIVQLGDMLWISGITDLYLFDPVTGNHVSREALFGGKIKNKGRPITKLIKVDNDNLVALCDDFILFFNQASGMVEAVKTPSGIDFVVQDAIIDMEMSGNGTIFLLSPNALYLVEARTKILVQTVDLSEQEFTANCVSADDNDLIYLGTQTGTVVKGRARQGQFQDTISYFRTTAEEPILDIHVHRDNNLVVRTRCSAIYFFAALGIQKMLIEDACFRPIMNELNDKVVNDRYLTSTYPFSYEVDLSRISLNDQLPRLDLKELRVNGEKRRPSTHPDGDRGVRLKYNENFLSIDFSLINFRDAKHTSYQYFLEGYDTDWTTRSEETSAYYTGVPPGRYSFKVRAANNDGKWTPHHQLLGITIVPPWWWSTGAKILWGLLFFGGIGMVIQNRIQQVRNEEAQKYRYQQKLTDLELQVLRIQMNPHFMFNSLNSIKNYILQAKPYVAAEYLSNFAHLIRMILQHSREKEITLFQELEMLGLYIELEQLRFRDGFKYEKYIDPSLDTHGLTLPPMILQPFVENAIWHGLLHKEGIRILKLEVIKKSEHIEIVIDDNGIGRKKARAIKSKSASKYKSMGMGITRERIDLVNQMNSLGLRFIIIDKEDQNGNAIGTLVRVQVPPKPTIQN